MAANFDPYQAWLGIPPGARPPNHYQLLGLELFESEPPIIAEAAEERTERVAALAAGPQAELGRLLIEELAAARKVLISAATRRAYEVELRQKLGMAPAPQPRAPAAPVAYVAPTPAATPVAATPVAAMPVAATPVAAVPVAAQPVAAYPAAAQAVPMATVPMAAVPMAAVPVAAAPMATVPMAMPAAPYAAQAVPMAGGYVPTAVAPGVAMPVMAAAAYAPAHEMPDLALHDEMSEPAYRPSFRRQSSGSWALVTIGFLVMATLGAVCFFYRERLLAALENRPEPTEVVSSSTTPGPEAKPPAMHSETDDAMSNRGESKVPQPNPGNMASADLSSPNLASRGPLPTEQSSNMNPPKPKQVKRPDARKTPPKTPAAPKQAAPQVALPSLNKPASAEEKAAVAKSLNAVRKALGERNNVKAAEQLNLATLEAAAPESLAAINRMQTLEAALKAFWKAVDQGIKGLKPVDELNYDGKTAVVINAEPTSISIRVEGQSKEYQVSKLPTGLAYHLAERWLREGDPQTKVLLGAFLYVEPKADRQKARQLWEDAARSGADVAKLLVQLDLDLANEAGK